LRRRAGLFVGRTERLHAARQLGHSEIESLAWCLGIETIMWITEWSDTQGPGDVPPILDVAGSAHLAANLDLSMTPSGARDVYRARLILQRANLELVRRVR
jgi:hypothetical protein